MSLLHDFSDPATVEEDRLYWSEFYKRNYIEADAARIALLREKMKARADARVANTAEDLKKKVAAKERTKQDDLNLKIFWRTQEINTARTPEMRVMFGLRHLQEDIKQLSAAWHLAVCLKK